MQCGSGSPMTSDSPSHPNHNRGANVAGPQKASHTWWVCGAPSGRTVVLVNIGRVSACRRVDQSSLGRLAVGETVILQTSPLHPIKTTNSTEGRGGVSRMTVSPTTAAAQSTVAAAEPASSAGKACLAVVDAVYICSTNTHTHTQTHTQTYTNAHKRTHSEYTHTHAHLVHFWRIHRNGVQSDVQSQSLAIG